MLSDSGTIYPRGNIMEEYDYDSEMVQELLS